MILNVLGATRFRHVAKVLLPPGWVSIEYKRAVWPFIWKSKWETVSRKRCVAPIARGGLNIGDFETIKGLVKKYRGGGPEHFEMWLIKNT